MKIKFPNPDDYVNDVMGFLEQMELCVHHAKKSAEKILSKHSPEDIKEGNDTPWVSFRLPVYDNDNANSEALLKLDPDREFEKDIELCIEEV